MNSKLVIIVIMSALIIRYNTVKLLHNDYFHRVVIYREAGLHGPSGQLTTKE